MHAPDRPFEFLKKSPPPENSYLALTVCYEGERTRLEKNHPESLVKTLELSDRESVKSASYPRGFDQLEVLMILKKETSTFALHDCLRKAFNFDFKRTQHLHIDTTTLSAEDARRVIHAAGNLLVLTPYEPRKFGRKAQAPRSSGRTKNRTQSIRVSIASRLKDSEAQETLRHGAAQGNATNLVRYFAELPGNELRPKQYRDSIRDLAKKWGAEFRFLDEKTLQKRGANAFLAVARAIPGGEHGIVHLIYRPKNRKPRRRIALVGKGLCFDTGGYNIKTGESMLDMHRDMTGSAVALALFGHLIQEKSEDEIHAFLALAENLISPTAFRPNDVIIASNGLSIEVVDTDAEGRMVLSDTLVYACEQKPDLIIDFATLTGAVVRAIGTTRCGVFSNDPALAKLAVECGESSGERVWNFPIGDDYWDALQSEIADLRQCSTNNYCDHIYAATFLSAFVTPETAWLHVDLAADSNKGGLGLSHKDVTGFGIRFAEELIRRFQSPKRTNRG